MVKYGVEKWSERPLFGWGPNASLGLIRQAEKPQLHILGHFHNTYIEVVLQLGILGAAFFVWLNLRLAKTMMLALRSRQMSRDYALFVIGAAGLFMISAVSDFGVPKRAWAFSVGLLAAIVYGYALKGPGAVSTGRLQASGD
jgi:O-antigen ligase